MKRQQLRRKLFRWQMDLEDDFLKSTVVNRKYKPGSLPDRFFSNGLWTLTEWFGICCCGALGHQPVADQCGIAAHDYCAWCGQPQPNKAER